MGFDNECILNIQSLAGEYFCPVCRLLVYPNEALQSQCTHLYCKPCLTYVVGTTKACPYDGYLVTEADSKPLVESNKTLAETIGKIAVQCLYHRSGCTWQGELSECVNHCAGCAFGNSPVVCNRCGTQIVHRQVQEHAQSCPGVQPQAQQADGSQVTTTATAVTATSGPNQTTIQAGVPASQAQVAQIAVAPTSGLDQSQTNTNSQPQGAVQVVPTPEQLYQQQQQYQQYYQQYPGYDPYQQQYQQYASYQQQAYPQYQQQGSMPQAQMYMQPQPQSQTQLPVQPQAQAQAQAQAQSQSHPQPQPQPQVQTQPPIHAHPQAQIGVQPQVQPQGNVPNQIQPSHPHPQMQPQPPQLYSQAPSHQQPHPPQLQLQPHIQQPPQVAQHQQTLTQPQQQMHPYPQQQSVAQSQVHPQSQVQPHTHVQVQQHQMQPQTRPPSQPQMQPPHPSSHAVTGHQSYPQPANQQMPPVASQLQSIHMQPQLQGAPRQLPQQTQVPLPQQQLAQMRPPQSHVPMQQQQQQAMVPPQNQLPNVPPVQQPAHNYPHQPNQPIQQYTGVQLPLQQNMSQQQVHGHALHSQAFPGQTPGLVQNTPQQPVPFTQHQSMQPQLHSAVPSLPLPPASHAQQQSQQNVSLSHGFQSQGSQTYGGRPMLQNHGVPRQPYQPSPVGLAGPTHAKMQSTGVQQFPPRPNTRPHSSAEQQLGGYMHRPGVPQSGNAAPVSSSPAPMSVTKTQFSSEHPIMKPKLQDEAASQTTGLNGANVLPTTLSQGFRLNESNGKPENEPRSELELKSMGGDGNSVNEFEITGSHSKSAGKESLESSQALEKSPVSSTQEGLDEPVVKNTVKEETMSNPESSSVGILAESAVQNKEVIPRITQKPDGDSQPDDKEAQDDGGNHSYQQTGMFDGKNGKVLNDSTESHGNVALRVKSHKHETNGDALSSQEKNILQHQSSYQDRFHQVHPISDQMSIQNRHLHQIQVRPPAHMRPQGNNILGNVPLQGHPLSAPPHFQQSMANQPRGILQSEVYPGGIAGAASFGGGPGSLGPRGHLNTGQMLPHRSDAPRVQGDSVGRPAFGGPPPGAFDCQPVTAGRLHPPGQQILSAPMDSGINANKMSGYYDGRQPDFHMPGTADRVSFAQPSNMQSDVMKMNGGSSRRLSGGPPDPSYPFGLQEERFKHFPEERYRQLPEGFNMPGEERRSGFPVEPGRHTVNPREFFDDLKKFPRPTHLDAEHVPKSENYFSSSRPLDRTPHGFISDARLNLGSSASVSRLPLPSQASGPKFNVRDDIAGRKMDHFGIHPDFHRSGPESGRLHMDGFPPFRSPGREFPDIPPTRFGRIEDNDGRESHNFGERPKPFNLHSDNNPFPERRFPGFSNHLRKEEFNVQGNLRIGERIRPMGEDLVGPDILPRHLRSGGPEGPRNLQMGESGGYGSLPNALRLGDVGGPGNMPIGGNIPSHSRPGFSRGMPIHGYGGDAGLFDTGEIESLDHTRKRKHVSNGWCRICKVDCETVEGLELHSQTREHQKMAMDMVLSIKKDNAKKHKISSDDHIAHEGNTNKTRQANVENHGN